MSDKREIDPVTQTEIMPHEWDGIRELDTAPPRWWILTYAACVVFSVGYWVVYPAWPTLSDFTRGAFGWNSREAVAAEVAAASALKKPFEDKIAAASTEQIAKDPELFNYAMLSGRTAYLDNCAQCHGSGAQGVKGFPSLLDDDWIWGGTLADIERTLRVGVRSGHLDARFMTMPAFGTDQLLDAAQIADVSDYVLSLSGKADPAHADGAARGAAIFAENCASCHGDQGQGDREMGAPRLNDAIWLYGGERDDVIQTVTKSRAGVMPNWEGRLSDETIKKLTVYVHSQGGGE